MDKKSYHHGDLKQQLIENGLLLLNQKGLEGFSLRKVASMCGVSHTAPYKHFRDKDELVNAINEEVSKKFYSALSEVASLYKNAPKLQIIEIGKAYVRFMVENPEYLKFMFLSDNPYSIKIKDNIFYECKENSAFSVFIHSSKKYFEIINLDKDLYIDKILSMWSLVHGMAILISKKSIEYRGNYLKLTERIIRSSLEI
ncbi:transcriptional regulator, TetR family [Clostridium pasteurianum DSM 525 = ATCC 6013]|uniref:Transcriptional regulator, TetR family n=1 Tax=Clostridium pasteurianum DSM 525 = ATCC 6013 TaxID=1262449 RepID=A0A0H3J0W4_CLOPA|nr:TetR/AcrR family transcriptional regulator [Clostridium pasteurianum]AJA46989.1 transcriptional regulator, TetR family [Clostridium pasteurianum DSM 525 = ATCC 6013]AJA50977.1 transcriptional regulator, TetR family [Clostridium pasteurianum DSM 525 = ATCC 6013]AOZ74366.1 AcrR family transcriptional regulator [Clostridium pasteurianum DSM 525 = ATCC 6013]AOZ78164.1 AcrR family transcriptional regulator [Clostridium pasteurianum]ELP58240.1 TetR family transcriptional regulator [Clostridium pa